MTTINLECMEREARTCSPHSVTERGPPPREFERYTNQIEIADLTVQIQMAEEDLTGPPTLIPKNAAYIIKDTQ